MIANVAGCLGALAAAAFLVWFGRRWPVVGLGCLFLLFSFVWRLVSAAFLDAFGPVYAIELFDSVGGSGAGLSFGVLLVITVLTIAAALLAPSRRVSVRPQALPTGRIFTIGDLGLFVFGFFILALYVDMFRRGVVPLFVGMERGEYTLEYGGQLHAVLFDVGNLLVFAMGVLSVYPRMLGRHTDLRYVALLVCLFAYAVLTGHRFSAFLSFTIFFVLPRAALHLGPGVLLPDPRFESGPLRRLLRTLTFRRFAYALGLATVTGILVNSYLNVRGFEAATALISFMQRVLVQPAELWFVTYDRVIVAGDFSTARAFEFLFFDPIDPTRSTSTQYLMALALGQSTAARVIGEGVQYNGGYPEIFFEMFGPVWGVACVLAVAGLTGLLLRATLRAIREGRLASAFAAMYVLYALMLTLTSGMLNFLIAWTFWVKVGLLWAMLLLERDFGSGCVRLLPWVLWRAAPPRHPGAISR